MIADDRSATIDNIICNIHKKQIIGLRLQQNEKNKMNCLDCIQQQNDASNLTDPLTFLEQLSLKRQQLVQIADQWKKLSTNFLEIIQTEIKKFPVKITNYIELEQGIELYTSGIFSFEQQQKNIDQFFKRLAILHQNYKNGYNLIKVEVVPKVEYIQVQQPVTQPIQIQQPVTQPIQISPQQTQQSNYQGPPYHPTPNYYGALSQNNPKPFQPNQPMPYQSMPYRPNPNRPYNSALSQQLKPSTNWLDQSNYQNKMRRQYPYN